MSGCWAIASLLFGMTCVARCSSADSPVTADQALASGKKLCAPLVSDAITPVHWIVYSANDGSDLDEDADENGDYWLVVGQYTPQTPPGVMSVISMLIWVPKNGTQPKPCIGISD
jgi:hypothetical protein